MKVNNHKEAISLQKTHPYFLGGADRAIFCH